MINKKLFHDKMRMLFEFYNKKVSPDMYEIYYEALSQLDNSQFLSAVDIIIKTSKFMPMPIDFIKISHESMEEKAIFALNKVEKAFCSVGIYGGLHFQDEKINKTIEIIGGWVKICSMSDNDWKFARKDFIKIYKLMPELSERIELKGIGEQGGIKEIGVKENQLKLDNIKKE